jgi:hypothetical protein
MPAIPDQIDGELDDEREYLIAEEVSERYRGGVRLIPVTCME